MCFPVFSSTCLCSGGPSVFCTVSIHVFVLVMCMHIHCTCTCTCFICRQKTTISKLQQDVHESEAKLHHLMVAQVREHGGSVLEARLQVCTTCTPTYTVTKSTCFCFYLHAYTCMCMKLRINTSGGKECKL